MSDDLSKWLHILLARTLTDGEDGDSALISHEELPPKMPFVCSPPVAGAASSGSAQRKVCLH